MTQATMLPPPPEQLAPVRPKRQRRRHKGLWAALGVAVLLVVATVATVIALTRPTDVDQAQPVSQPVAQPSDDVVRWGEGESSEYDGLPPIEPVEQGKDPSPNTTEPITAESDKPDNKDKQESKGDSHKQPGMTAAQENAIEVAEDYLDFQGFSKTGLVGQLEYEKFTPAQAWFAVNHINVNWNQQAVRVAESYLDFMSFSRQGLIDQLEYEGFTTAQATYGVNKAY